MDEATASRSAAWLDLAQWRSHIDALLVRNRAAQAVPLIQIVLNHLPRYLPIYTQMLQALWLDRRWLEGERWALRLLRADPAQEIAWAMLAQRAEDEGQPTGAHRYWRLAFEQAPYNRTIRSGLARTTAGQARSLALNRATLAAIYRSSGQWQKSLALYSHLVTEQPARADYQCGLLEALWQLQRTEPALALARTLVQREPHLLLGWLVSAHLGDEDDQALAQAPLTSLDADGAYAAARYAGPNPYARPVHIAISAQEAALFQATTGEVLPD